MSSIRFDPRFNKTRFVQAPSLRGEERSAHRLVGRRQGEAAGPVDVEERGRIPWVFGAHENPRRIADGKESGLQLAVRIGAAREGSSFLRARRVAPAGQAVMHRPHP
jgi:hypothetical protein